MLIFSYLLFTDLSLKIVPLLIVSVAKAYKIYVCLVCFTAFYHCLKSVLEIEK